MRIELEEAKKYLRVDSSDEDEIITSMIECSENLVAGVCRIDVKELENAGPLSEAATLYALAYLYEHREEADHHALVMDLRNILFGERREVF